MFNLALQSYPELGLACRIGPLARHGDRLRTQEIVALLLAGGLATVAVAQLSPAIPIPGHAILRAALPMVCGVALVPRRFVGSVMMIGAASVALIFSASGLGTGQPAALVSLLALGPAIDIAMSGTAAPGWRLYLRFALAGILANSLAFAARVGTSWLGLDGPGPHSLAHFDIGVFLSFVLCGAAAGLLSAAVWFRHSARPAVASEQNVT